MNTTEPGHTYILPPNLRRRALNIFQRALPRPLTDDPEDTEERDAEAIDDITSLRPVNNEEVLLAVQFVVANAQAHDVLGVIPIDGRDDLRQLAQAANMMRQSRGARLLLMRVQAERMRCERIAGATNAAARVDPQDAPVRVQTPTDAPAEDRALPRCVTDFETESHFAGNETPVRPSVGASDTCATVMADACATVMADACATVMADASATVVALLDPAIPPGTVRGEPVPDRLCGDGRVKPGHDDGGSVFAADGMRRASPVTTFR